MEEEKFKYDKYFNRLKSPKRSLNVHPPLFEYNAIGLMNKLSGIKLKPTISSVKEELKCNLTSSLFNRIFDDGSIKSSTTNVYIPFENVGVLFNSIGGEGDFNDDDIQTITDMNGNKFKVLDVELIDTYLYKYDNCYIMIRRSHWDGRWEIFINYSDDGGNIDEAYRIRKKLFHI